MNMIKYVNFSILKLSRSEKTGMMTDSRMSMSYGSARPSFGLVPSAATTGSDMLNFSDLKQEMAAFTARFDAWIAKKRDAIDSGKVQHRRRLTELDGTS